MKWSFGTVVAIATAASVLVCACATNDDATPDAPDGASATTGDDAAAGTMPDADSPDAQSPDSGGTTGKCGDGNLDKGEQCDDGNLATGDGCNASCNVESAGPEDVCSGTVLTFGSAVAGRSKATVTGSTAHLFNQYGGSCGGSSGADAVYVVTPPESGVLTLDLASDFDSILYARSACGEANAETSCADAPGTIGGEHVAFAVTAGQPVYLFVDGYSGAKGTFTLDAELSTSSCGDGVVIAPEQCDDGNNADGDGCAADCSFELGGVVSNCPGRTLLLSGVGSAPRHIGILGATVGSSTQGFLQCLGGGPNDIYAVRSDVTGSLTARVVAAFDGAAVGVRTECTDVNTQVDCRSVSGVGTPAVLTVPIRAGIPEYVQVDSTAYTYLGAYTVDITVNPSVCGNKVLDGDEQCDDGNTTNGDGCSATCTLEPLPTGIDTCPGSTLALAEVAGAMPTTYAASITASTSTLTSDYTPKTVNSVNKCTANAAKDAVFVVTSPIDGQLKATVAGNFDSMVYARTTCAANSVTFSDVGCTNQNTGSTAEQLSVPIAKNVPTYIVVDGAYNNTAGVFRLDAVVTAAICGNGVVDGGETCDDAATVDGDGCSAICQLEPNTSHDNCSNVEAIPLATNGTHQSATITSGTTNLVNDHTFSACYSAGLDAMYKVRPTMDGVLRARVDSATFNVSLGARSACATSGAALTCSDVSNDRGPEEIAISVVHDTDYYLIVDGATASDFGRYTLSVDVMPAGCGDSLVSVGEQCDDGNAVNGDGCSSTCTLESIPGIDTCPGFALSFAETSSGSRVGSLTIDTSKLASDYGSTCGGSGPEGVVVVTPPINGTLTVKTVGTGFQPVMYVRMKCTDATTEKVCDVDTASVVSRDITITGVVAGTPYYFFVDGYNYGSGVARFTATVAP